MKKLNRLFMALLFTSFSCSFAGASVNITPLEGLNIMIDPGHGGVDSGAVGYYGLKEADANLRVARYLKQLLEADGAKVTLTRESDSTLSLTDRVKKANLENPDLFVSVHHNASLSTQKETRAEIYYAARDTGFSKLLGEEMLKQLKNIGFGKEYRTVPGGFHVLRNTNIPAILTEGAYLSVPETELKLMSGKTLTDQAQAYRLAIRNAYSKLMRVNYMSESTVNVNTPYPTILFTPDRPLEKVNARLLPQNCFHGFKVEKLTPWGNTYKLYSRSPLNSGNFKLETVCYGTDGSVSGKKIINLNIKLPVSDVVVAPAAPYIPKGFKGRFPIIVYAIDSEGRPNTTESPISFTGYIPDFTGTYRLASAISDLRSLSIVDLYYEQYGQRGYTDKTGCAVFYLNLTGDEKGHAFASVFYGTDKVKYIQIPIRQVDSHYVLGKVVDEEGKPVVGARLSNISGDEKTITSTGGYFFFKPKKNSLKVKITAEGYAENEFYCENLLEPVSLPVIKMNKISSKIFGKGFGILSRAEYKEKANVFAYKLAKAGANVIRLRLNEKSDHPEYAPIIRANEIEGINGIVSFKPTKGNEVEFRHYHSSQRGKALALAAANSVNDVQCGVKAKYMAASEYELNHSQAVAIVVGIPEKIADDVLDKVIEQIYQAYATEF